MGLSTRSVAPDTLREGGGEGGVHPADALLAQLDRLEVVEIIRDPDGFIRVEHNVTDDVALVLMERGKAYLTTWQWMADVDMPDFDDDDEEDDEEEEEDE